MKLKRTSKSNREPVKLKSRILILCEGETECEYFEAFKQDTELKYALAAVDIKIYKPTDFSPLGLVNEAKEKKKEAERKKNPFDSIWVVFDRDGHANVPEAFQTALDSKIKRAFSSISFEYWVLLHFEFTTRSFKNSDAVVSYIRGKHYPDYVKGTECFTFLRTKLKTAIEHAERICKRANEQIDSGFIKLVDHNPYTNVHDLVNELLKLKKS